MTARIGVGLISLGCFLFWAVEHWMATRTFVALDMPVSLARGHIRTGLFSINLRDTYQVRLDPGENRPFDPNCAPYNLFKVRWDLYSRGQIVASLDEQFANTYIGGFDGKKQDYDLDLEILSDGSCLNPGHPRLSIYTDESDYTNYATPLLWLSALCVAAGAGLLTLVSIAHFEEAPAATVSRSGLQLVNQYFQSSQRLPLGRRFSGLPSFGIVGSITWFLLLVSTWILTIMTSPDSIPAGLKVRILRPGVVPGKTDPWTEPVAVRIEDAGPGLQPHLYVNSRPVSWEDLGRVLKQDLKPRPPGWVVVVEADPNIAWQSAVDVVDVIRAVPAETVLLTPDTVRMCAQHHGKKEIE